MTESIQAESKADIDPRFERSLRKLRDAAKREHDARTAGAQSPQWTMPLLQDEEPDEDATGWDGNLFDLAGAARAFDRTAVNAQFVSAVADVAAPGVSGDLVVTTLQIDYMAAMQRAFVARHTMRRPRTMLHAMGRRGGHGNDAGVFIGGVLESLRGIVAESKQSAGNGNDAE